MPGVAGAAAVVGGLFILLWYRTVARLPARRRPEFTGSLLFRRVVPATSAVLLAGGLLLLARNSALTAAAGALLAAALWVLVTRFDRYSAEMRVMHGHYTRLKHANPGMSEADVLFHLSRRRYPGWSEDRIVELVAGMDVRSLILLMMISEHEVNPLADWDLYRSLRARAARIVRDPK